MSATYLLQTVSRIPSIPELHLPNCQLSDPPLTLPFLNFTSLSVLDLSNNGFKSTIPDWLFNFKSLVKLDLSNNHFHGEIPDAISNLAFLERLDLSGNSIGGKLSRNLGKLCNLRSMELYDNKISGEIVDYFDSLSECFSNRLETLDLGDNGVMGKLPDALGYIKSLRVLRLSNNSLQRLLPCSVGNLKSLQKILLGDNRMSIIPENLGQLSKLVVLDISESIWEGILTEAHLMNLSSLKKLAISCANQSPNNISLVFNISFDWIPPFKLKYLSIKSCQLGPKFPTWLQNQDELSTLSLINASISDTIPNWFWQMDVKLDMLDLSYNNIGGRVLSSLSFNKHSSVYLLSNHFDGLFPLLSSNITTLYLSINQFLRPILDDIGEAMPLLSTLDISFNSLTRSIPLSIGNLSKLTVFVISNNKLSGQVPLGKFTLLGVYRHVK